MATTLQTRRRMTAEEERDYERSIIAGVQTLWLKHMYKFVHSKMEIIGTLFTPLLWMLIFGLCMDTVVRDLQALNINISYEAYITPGVMLLTGLTAAILGGTTLLNERLNGTIKEYLVAPVPRLAILLGTMASGLTKAIGQSLIVLALGLLLDRAVVFNAIGFLVGLVMVLLYSLGFVGLSTAIASKSRSMESYHTLIILFNLPVLFLSNALYPLEKMPMVLRVVTFLNPTTYAVDAIRHLFYGTRLEIGLAIDATVLVLFAFLGIAIGYSVFKKSVDTVLN